MVMKFKARFMFSCFSNKLTSLLSEAGLNVQEAHAFYTADGFSLDVFVVDGWPHEMNMIKVSNIMRIDPKPFDPKTFVEEDAFVADDSGHNKQILLENNIVLRNPNGTTSYESNARFVRWSYGSLQLLIGNEVLDISVQDAQHDQAHLFLRHEKGILQSQGRVLKKMRFMPSSLTSNSHRLLTALVDSRHKNSTRVKK